MSMITEFTNKINSLFDEREIENLAKKDRLIARNRKSFAVLGRYREIIVSVIFNIIIVIFQKNI